MATRPLPTRHPEEIRERCLEIQNPDVSQHICRMWIE